MSSQGRFGRRNEQPREANYVARDRAPDAIPVCTDPDTLALARAIACAIRESRPVVTLPPHIFIPWRAEPFTVESRRILDATETSGAGTVGAGATFAADAEGLPAVIAEDTDFTALASLVVPQGHIAILRHWAAQPDLGGYILDSDGVALVKLRLKLGDKLSINGPTLRGLVGSIDQPFDVSYVIPERQTIAIEGLSGDTAMWHYVESFIDGYLIQSTDVFGDSMKAILEKCP